MKYLTYDYDMTICVCYNEKCHHYYLYFCYKGVYIPIKKNSALKIKTFLQSTYTL